MNRSRAVLTALVAALVLGPLSGAPAVAQTYTDLGMMSGSGLVLMPTTIVSPEAQFRVGLGRIGRTDEAGRGLNLLTIGMGFSPIIEMYARFTSEQAGYAQSMGTIGFGGKVMVPVQLPLLRVVSVWGESSMSEMVDESVLTSPGTTRAALLSTPVWSTVLRPMLLIGASKRNGAPAQLMAGANLVIAPGHHTQFGLEYIHAYEGAGSHHAVVSGTYRVLPNVSIQGGPGYVSSPKASGWLWSLAISVNTADIDFQPEPVRKQEEYTLPTLEELLKPAGNDTTGGETPKKPDNQDHKENRP